MQRGETGQTLKREYEPVHPQELPGCDERLPPLASKTSDGAVAYHHADHPGSLDAATKSGTTGPQETVAYYPFGQTRIDTGTTTLDRKYTGKEYDPELSSGAGATSGLYHYGARYYDPVIGRFISPDTIEQSPGDPQTI